MDCIPHSLRGLREWQLKRDLATYPAFHLARALCVAASRLTDWLTDCSTGTCRWDIPPHRPKFHWLMTMQSELPVNPLCRDVAFSLSAIRNSNMQGCLTWRPWTLDTSEREAAPCTIPSCAILHCTALLCPEPHCTALYCTTLNCPILHCSEPYRTALSHTSLYCTALQQISPLRRNLKLSLENERKGRRCNAASSTEKVYPVGSTSRYMLPHNLSYDPKSHCITLYHIISHHVISNLLSADKQSNFKKNEILWPFGVHNISHMPTSQPTSACASTKCNLECNIQKCRNGTNDKS